MSDKESKNAIEELGDSKVTRRDFIKGGVAATAAVTAAATLGGCATPGDRARAGQLTPQDEYLLNKAENVILTSCLGCNTGCAIKVKHFDGYVAKVTGNPLSPWGVNPHLNYETNLRDLEKQDSAICPRGNAGAQQYYDPYRIKTVLKRAGRRGEMRWMSIPFDQAINEIVNGGRLFAHVPGEENRVVEGLNDIFALRDPEVSSQMAVAVREILHEPDRARKTQMVSEFQTRFRDHLHTLIDPNHPDLGPKNNQFTFNWGRIKAGRRDFLQRFTYRGLGSTNTHGHTTVCQGSLYFASYAMSEQWRYNSTFNKMRFQDGRKFYWTAELERAKFVIFIGANVFEGNYGPPMRAHRITEAVTSGRMKYAWVDPRFGKGGAHAWKWLPIKPGGEGAMCMAMVRWIMENKKYDAEYLQCANRAASNAIGQPTFSNTTWLVKIDANNQPGRFLRADEIGFPKEMLTSPDGRSYHNEKFVVLRNGQPVEVDPNDTTTPVIGDLYVDTTVRGFRVKSALQILLEEAQRFTINEYAADAGLDPNDILELAREFTSHGKLAAIDCHRGVSQHTNGYYSSMAVNTLNLLIGNYDWGGGFITKRDFSVSGPNVTAHPGRMTHFGNNVVRSAAHTAGYHYEQSTYFDGYPAKRNWFAIATDLYQEIIPSMLDKYPYQTKIYFLYMGAQTYANPAMQPSIDGLLDPNIIPLHVTIDTLLGESSVFADYVIPDGTFFERWEFQGSVHNIHYMTQPVRQPAALPYPDNCTVYGQTMPIGMESFLIGLAEKLNLSGFGPNGFGPGIPLTHLDHFYLKQVANLATTRTPVPDADDEEMRIFREARRHLPRTVFDEARWREACGAENWRKVVYVLNRGGRFVNYEDAWDGDLVANKFGGLICMYPETTAIAINSMTGKPYFAPAAHKPLEDSLGRSIIEVDEANGFNLRLISYKIIQHTKSRTNGIYWLLEIEEENFILMNATDARNQGFRDGDRARIVSATSDGIWHLGPWGTKDVIAKIKTTEGMRPGVIAFSLGWGHNASGSRDYIIDGRTIKGDPRRGKGIQANITMRLDPHITNIGLQDLIGGSTSFSDTQVRLVRV